MRLPTLDEQEGNVTDVYDVDDMECREAAREGALNGAQ